MRKSFKNGSFSRKLFIIFNSVFMIFLCAAVLLPFVKILSESLVNHTTYGLDFFTQKPDFIAYNMLKHKSFLTPLAVSVITTLTTTVLGVLISSIAAYILIQRDMPGVKLFKWLLMLTLFFDAGFIPQFLVIKRIGLYNSLWAIILPMSVNVTNIFLLKSYFEQLPQSLKDAAEIDGCTPVGVFLRIMLPLARAPLAVCGLLFATAAWNEYLRYIMYIADTKKYNLQYTLRDWLAVPRNITDDDMVNVKTYICAKIVVTMLPAFVLYPIFFKFVEPKMMHGAVKE